MITPNSNNEEKTLPSSLEIVTKREVDTEYKKFQVFYELVKLFNEFSINLVCLIHDTYLGETYIKTKSDIDGHFNWSFKKVLQNYEDIGIFFKNYEDIYEYFYKHFNEVIYKNKDYTEEEKHRDIEYFNTIIEYDKPKLRKEFLALINVYIKFYKCFC